MRFIVVLLFCASALAQAAPSRYDIANSLDRAWWAHETVYNQIHAKGGHGQTKEQMAAADKLNDDTFDSIKASLVEKARAFAPTKPDPDWDAALKDTNRMASYLRKH